MKFDGEATVAHLVQVAEDFQPTNHKKNALKAAERFELQPNDPLQTVLALRDILARCGALYNRGGPVQIRPSSREGSLTISRLSKEGVVLLAHTHARPYVVKRSEDRSASEVDARLPLQTAAMYLDPVVQWKLPTLNGIALAPLLLEDGSIDCREGYVPEFGLWCENVPDVTSLVPDTPILQDAQSALLEIRKVFRTFCFSDAPVTSCLDGTAPSIDVSLPPTKDESCFLAALLTAVCRPSLELAPGVLVRAAAISGSGAGKGLLARCICLIAYGREPHAVTSGNKAAELDKRLAAELMQGSPVVFLDNVNNTALTSDLLACSITERPVHVRVLGRSELREINATSLIVVTGNGLSLAEDLVRRFIFVELDPKSEDPESRSFEINIRKFVLEHRTELLSWLLIIWRWGRINSDLPAGKPLGSFEQWCKWVRDPLLALGCQDPVDRIGDVKRGDSNRQTIIEMFGAWWERHQDKAVSANKLHHDVKQIIDPHKRGRQFVSAQLGKLSGTRINGLMLTRQASAGKWGAATYALKQTDGDKA